MYDRLIQWSEFSQQVELHIEQYTLPQYGNEGGQEQVEGFTVEDCFQCMSRYINRRHARVRGNVEALRDLIKIAHYAQFGYQKLRAELGEPDVYLDPDMPRFSLVLS